MSLFKDMLGEQESLFKNDDALDPEWVPKMVPYRTNHQSQIASCIKPLLIGRNGKNCFVFGTPGVGKTVATKWVLRDLEENADDVYILYVNCWQKNTTYKIIVDLCEQLDYHFTQNKNTEDLFRVVQNMVNKKSAVFIFDEIDKVEDVTFLYDILTDIYKKTVVLIANDPMWVVHVDSRVRSRLLPDHLEFKPYSKVETEGILRSRLDYAFVPGCWDEDAFQIAVDRAAQAGDVRVGLHVLRKSGMEAEDAGSKKIKKEHAERAVTKLSDFSIKSKDDLDVDGKLVLDIVREKGGKMGELYDTYKEKGGTGTYKTFQRRIEKLDKGGYVATKKVIGGKEGTTTLVSEKNKSLTDF